MTTYRLVDEQPMETLEPMPRVDVNASSSLPRFEPTASFERVVFVTAAWFAARAVGFVAMIVSGVSVLAIALSLLFVVIYLGLGALVNFYRWDFIGVWAGLAFGSFCLFVAVNQVNGWFYHLPDRVNRSFKR